MRSIPTETHTPSTLLRNTQRLLHLEQTLENVVTRRSSVVYLVWQSHQVCDHQELQSSHTEHTVDPLCFIFFLLRVNFIF
ncbi:hypothetical protein Pcinc_032364 [Petrolisthes cinctipes]|uniref:Uncharacterized protein n=1 Tax=Petrolisthes cinctipes TaxID=88211 RepID=A0AAE1EU89_PETCI|nr:hypothetical protein Pcinc_032364 [Petrolisthes cinctipes]